MRAFNISSLSIILFSLLRVGKTLAVISEDAFGITNYGFKCHDRIYKKSQIFAAAKKLCDAKSKQQDLTFKVLGDDLTFRAVGDHTSPESWIRIMVEDLNFFARKPFSSIPILSDGTLFPIDSYQNSPTVDNSNGDSVIKDPGPDRLVIDKNCRIMGSFTDLGPTFEDINRYKKCRILKHPGDFSESLESPSTSRDNSPIRSPNEFHSRSPSRSPRHSQGNSARISERLPQSLFEDS